MRLTRRPLRQPQLSPAPVPFLLSSSSPPCLPGPHHLGLRQIFRHYGAFPPSRPPSLSLTQENRVTEEEIKKVFERFGTVTCVSIKTNTFDQDSGLQKGYAFVHYEVSSEGRMSAYQAVNALADVVVDRVRYVTEFSRNFMRLEHSLSDGHVRPRPYCGVPFPSTGYGYLYPSPYPHPMASRYAYPMPCHSVPLFPAPAPYFLPVQYPHTHMSHPASAPANPLYHGNSSTGLGSQQESPPSPSSSWSPLEDPVLPDMDYSSPPQESCSQEQQGSWPVPTYFPMAYPHPYHGGLYPYRPQAVSVPSYGHPPAAVQAYYHPSGYPAAPPYAPSAPVGYSYYTEENH
jgi:hypothetical protein